MTREKKLLIYLLTLEIFDEGKQEGLCGCVILALIKLKLNDPTKYSAQKIKEFTPELWALKPKDRSIGEFWWDGKTANQQRREALTKIINDLSNE